MRVPLDPPDPAGLARALAALARAPAGEARVLEVVTPADVTPEALLAILGPHAGAVRLSVGDVSLAFACERSPAPAGPPPGVQLDRLARPELAAVAQAFESSFRAASPAGAPATSFAAQLDGAAFAGLARVARLEERVAGVIAPAMLREGVAAVGVVRFVGVAAWARGRGAGRTLQREAVRALFAAGASEVRGGASLANGTMLRIFEELGYEQRALVQDVIVE